MQNRSNEGRPQRRWYAATLCALLLSGAAHAQSADAWNGADKRQHFMVSSAFGVLASGLTDNRWKAFGGCLAAGAGKEFADATGGGKASAKDLVADALGCGAGIAFGRQMAVYSRQGGVQFIYRVEF